MTQLLDARSLGKIAAAMAGRGAFDGVQLMSTDAFAESHSNITHKFDDILEVFKKNNLEILDISTDDGDLEDVFIQLTNN